MREYFVLDYSKVEDGYWIVSPTFFMDPGMLAMSFKFNNLPVEAVTDEETERVVKSFLDKLWVYDDIAEVRFIGNLDNMIFQLANSRCGRLVCSLLILTDAKVDYWRFYNASNFAMPSI